MRNKDSFISKTFCFVLGAVAALTISGGAVFAIVNEFSDHVNILDDKALQLGTDTDIQFVYDEAGDNRLEITDGTNVLAHLTDAGTTGDFTVTGNTVLNGTTNPIGQVNFGTAASVKGTLNIEREATLNGWLKMESSNGTDVYFFPDNAGNFRTHTTAPTADGDGTQLATGSINDIIDDVTPQLGGNLDVNSFNITSAAAGDVAIVPDTTGDVILDGVKWPQADGTSGQALITDGAGQTSWSSAAGGDMSDLIDDLTPQLGGPLDVVTQEIVSTSTNDIDLHSNDDVIIELGDAAGVNELSIRDSAGTEVAIIDSDGTVGFGTASPAQKVHAFVNSTNSTRLRLENSEGFGDIVADAGFIGLYAGDGLIKLNAETSSVRFYQNAVPDVDISKDLGTTSIAWRNAYIRNVLVDLQVEVGTSGTQQGVLAAWNGSGTTPGDLQLESSDGTIWHFFVANDGTLRVTSSSPASDSQGSTVDGSATDLVSDLSPQLGAQLDVNNFAISSNSGNKDISITPHSNGSIVLDGQNWPQTDGATNTTLTTNGAGQLSWTNLAAGIASVLADTTPQLGGDLDVNGSDIVSASAGDITLTPDTTGDIILDGQKWPQADGSVDQVLTTNGSAQLAWASLKPTQSIIVACSDETTAIAIATGVVTFRMPYAFTLTEVRASLNVAGDDATLVDVDINESGVTIFSTQLTFDNGEKTTTTAATPAVLSDTSLADDAEMTVDIVAVDAATVTAAGLKITLIGKRT